MIAEAVTGRQRNIGPPVYERFVVPLALILVLLSGIGPLIAWRRATAANLKRNLVRPALVGVVTVAVLIALGVTSSWTALLMFGFGAFVVGGVVQELWRGVRARRAVARESVPVALVSLVKRNRRRYGGYFVHVGIVVLFVGVAASSSFKAVRDVTLQPGQTRAGRRRPVHLRQAGLEAARGDQRAPGADRVRRAAEGQARRQDADAAHVQGLLPRRWRAARCRASSTGESTTEVALDSGLHKDVWAAIAPDIVKLQPRIAEGDRVFTKAADDLTPEQSNEFLAVALKGLTDRYAVDPPAARFRFEVNPLVTWIWLGALIVLFGAFIAGWPSPRGLTRLASARYAARVGRDVRDQVPA